MSDTQKTPTAGFEFLDLRYSPCKIVEAVDIPAVVGDLKIGGDDASEVSIAGSNGIVYGPYRLDRQFARGNGKISFVAFKVGAGSVTKPPTKAELEAENIRLHAELAAAKKQQQPAKQK